MTIMYALVGFLISFCTLVTLSPIWYGAGKLAAKLRLLPLITGYLIAGVLSGPYVFNIITSEGLAALNPVNHVCLSLIALAAGAELQVAELRKTKRQVTWITLGITVCTWALVFPCATLLAPSIPFMAAQSPHTARCIASLVATLAVARSPASAIAVLKETEGKGPYCSLVMAVVVLKDVLVFICFSLNIQLARAAGKGVEEQGGGLLGAVGLLESLGGILISVALGAGGGYIMGAMRQQHIAASRFNPLHRLLPGGARARLRPAATVAVSATTFFLTELAHGEPLLACVTTGLVVGNVKFRVAQGGDPSAPAPASASDAMELLAADMARLTPAVNVAFFGLAGASLKLAAVRETLWAALLLYLVRLAGIWLGCYGGAALGRTPDGVGGRVWMGMVTQAGVALGLARVVGEAFPDWGPDFGALIAGVVLMNLFTGPPLFKAAVIAMGEARAMALPGMATEFDSRVKRDASRQQLSRGQIPQIPIISAALQSDEGLVSASSSRELRVTSKEMQEYI